MLCHSIILKMQKQQLHYHLHQLHLHPKHRVRSQRSVVMNAAPMLWGSCTCACSACARTCAARARRGARTPHTTCCARRIPPGRTGFLPCCRRCARSCRATRRAGDGRLKK